MHGFSASLRHKIHGGEFFAEGKHKNRASKINKLTFGYTAHLKEAALQVKSLGNNNDGFKVLIVVKRHYL